MARSASCLIVTACYATSQLANLNSPLPVVLIPAFRPEPVLPALVRDLLVSGSIAAVVIVDDGSGPAYTSIFSQLRETPGVQLLHHTVNLGKGAALKTGLNHFACTFPASISAITADADGQHTATDIIAVARAAAHKPGTLILGARQFDGSVPARSKFGNTLTRYIMRAVTGQRISDTQTGLRSIPRTFVADLLLSPAAGYDFELDMLVRCKHADIEIGQVPIATVYIDGNRSSHFNPLLDSMRIYFVLVRFAASSLITALIDNLVFIAILRLSSKLIVSLVAARLVAGTFNYYANKRGVFHSRSLNWMTALPKFWAVVLVSGTLSYLLIQNFIAYAGMSIVGAKVLAETIMFFFSFVVLRDFVFYQRS